MESTTILSRSEFNREVRAFKNQYHGKLKNLLDAKKSPGAYMTFFANPKICQYLMRQSIHFKDKKLALTDTIEKLDYDNSDHYELQIYKKTSPFIPYRWEGPGFYSKATVDSTEVFLLEQLKGCIQSSYVAFKGYTQPSIESRRASLIKAKATLNLALETRYLAPIELSICGDGHANLLVTISDPDKKTLLCTLMIESVPREANRHYDLRKQECDTVNQVLGCNLNEKILPQSIQRYLLDHFNVGLEHCDANAPPQTYRNQESILLINQCEEFNFHRDATISWSFEFKNNQFFLLHRNSTPFEMILHPLQTMPDDMNCVLYSINFAKGIAQLLENDPLVFDTIILAARTSDIETLVAVFQKKLKLSLPQYYNHDGTVKAPGMIEEFHLQQRWEVGNDYISQQHERAAQRNQKQ